MGGDHYSLGDDKENVWGFVSDIPIVAELKSYLDEKGVDYSLKGGRRGLALSHGYGYVTAIFIEIRNMSIPFWQAVVWIEINNICKKYNRVYDAQLQGRVVTIEIPRAQDD